MVIIRLRDPAFKRVLRRIHLDSEGKIDRPLGNLTSQNNAAPPAVPLASGMGIAPLRRIVMDSATEKLPHRIFLSRSNNRPVFRDELPGAEQQNLNYKLFATMTELETPSPPEGGSGLLVSQMLDPHLDAAHLRSGIPPDQFTTSQGGRKRSDLQTMLTNAGVDDDDIRIEEFSGY
jgi:ferredoxin-NADP reductase